VADALVMVDTIPSGRRRTADRVFLGSLIYTAALTLFWLYVVVSGRDAGVFGRYKVDAQAIKNIFFGLLFFLVIWGLIWYGVKTLVLRFLVGFSKEDRRAAFSSRMDAPYDVQDLVARYSERRIRIADMIGRRGRFITLQLAGFYYLYTRIAVERTPAFLTLALWDGLFDAMVLSWVFLSLYYSSGVLARPVWGPQTRVMDGTLGRANCLLITTLWSAFKFVMVPIGIQLSALFPPDTYATLFVMIWGSYVAADASAEIVGSLFGNQKLRVWGMGDVNRKSIAGTLAAFLASLTLCLSFVLVHHLPLPWVVLAVVIAVTNTFFELFSPRGTDDFTMATANALVCWAFGLLIY
jgi:hypothetical protein